MKICRQLKSRVLTFGEFPENVVVFHAGTNIEQGIVKSSGGRVMAITGLGVNMTEALDKSYSGIEKVQWSGKTYRKDIGFDLKRLGQ